MPISARATEQTMVARVGRAVLFGLACVADLAALYLLLTGLGRLRTGHLDPGLFAFSVFLGLPGLIGTFLGIRYFLGRSLYEELDLVLTEEAVLLGGVQTATIRLRTRRTVRIKEARLRLLREEKAVSQAGTRENTYIEIKPIETRVILTDIWLSPMEPREFQETLTIPADEAPTIVTDNTALLWSVELKIKVARWPDARLVCPFGVAPEIARYGREEATLA